MPLAQPKPFEQLIQQEAMKKSKPEEQPSNAQSVLNLLATTQTDPNLLGLLLKPQAPQNPLFQSSSDVNIFLLNYYIQNEREKRQKEDEISSLLKVLIKQQASSQTVDRNPKSDSLSHSNPEPGQSSDQADAVSDPKQIEFEQEKKKREIINCPHKTKKHYAKNMCITCYHRRGRTKKAWACPHSDKLHYSKGLCQNCYLARYYQNRKASKKKRSASPGSFSEVEPVQKRQKTTCSESEPSLKGDVESDSDAVNSASLKKEKVFSSPEEQEQQPENIELIIRQESNLVDET